MALSPQKLGTTCPLDKSQTFSVWSCGPEIQIEAFLDVCRPYGIKNVARTGTIAMPRQGTSGED